MLRTYEGIIESVDPGYSPYETDDMPAFTAAIIDSDSSKWPGRKRTMEFYVSEVPEEDRHLLEPGRRLYFYVDGRASHVHLFRDAPTRLT
jgi:hypothetical protein